MSNAEMTSFAFTPENLDLAKKIIAKYPAGKQQSAVMPLLDLAQRQVGWTSMAVIETIAEMLEMAPIRVQEVVTFYTLFFREPKGRHVVSVCHNLTCHLLGAQQALAHLKERLGVEVGGTTPDGRVTLLSVECLCACEMAPMLQVDDRYEGNLTPEKIDRILEGLA